MSRITILFLSCLFLVVSPAVAKEKNKMAGKAPYASAYDGLLPAGMTPSSAAGFHPSQLRDARVALVPSSNFNEWARVWERWFEEDGEKYKARGENRKNVEYSTNPRYFSEQVIQALQPHVGEVFIAADLVQARDAGADYYMILDGWLGSFTRWNTYLHATGGVTLLNADLQQAFSVRGEAKVKYEEPPLLQSFSPSAWEDVYAKNAFQAIDEMSRHTISGMQQHLSGSF